jgi:hypothetical protein
MSSAKRLYHFGQRSQRLNAWIPGLFSWRHRRVLLSFSRDSLPALLGWITSRGYVEAARSERASGLDKGQMGATSESSWSVWNLCSLVLRGSGLRRRTATACYANESPGRIANACTVIASRYRKCCANETLRFGIHGFLS